MRTKLAFRFRIYPDKKRIAKIDERLILAQQLYNKMLEKAKSERQNNKDAKMNRSTLNRYMKEAIAENRDFLKLYSQTRQNTFIRLQRAFQNFFRRCTERKNGNKIKAGFPRFKSRDRYNSITYPQCNGSFAIETERKTKMLRIARIGRMKIAQHRDIKGTVKTMTIKKEAGKYYAIFTAEQMPNLKEVTDTNPVGIDMGLNNFIALSDGKTLRKPRFFKQKERRIARWQRIVARRRKGSKRRRKAKEKLQNEWAEVTNRSDDFMHKLSDTLVRGKYTSFAVEELHIDNMVRNHRLAQSIQNASWNRFVQMLSYKAESAGMRLTKADARDTSRQCSSCGSIIEMPLSERTYICGRCGMRLDRDVNAAINILKRAREGHSRSHARGDSVRLQQEAVAAEPRTYPAIAGGSPRL